MQEWLAVILAIIVVVIIIIAIALIIARPWIKKDIPLNQPCSSSRLCVAGTTCINGTCKANPGEFCNVATDCGPQSIDCIDNICVTSEMINLIAPTSNSIQVEGLDGVYDQAPLPEYSDAQNCDCRDRHSHGRRCPRGKICRGSAVILNGIKKYQFGEHKILDVLELTTLLQIDGTGPLGSTVWILLENGTIMQDFNENITSLSSNIQPDRLFMLGTTVIGATSNGVMYQLDSHSMTTVTGGSIRRLNWNPVRWASSNIVHVSTSLDGVWLWTQSSHGGGSTGRLYNMTDLVSGNPRLVETEQMIGRIFRIYGENNNAHTGVNPITATGQSDVDGLIQVIPLMVDGAMTSANQIIRITPEDNHRIWSIRVFQQFLGTPGVRGTDNVYEIQNRLCE
jgi:hypothetical protein